MILLPAVITALTELARAAHPNIEQIVTLPWSRGSSAPSSSCFLIFEPDGLAAPLWKMIKAYWKLYPFSY